MTACIQCRHACQQSAVNALSAKGDLPGFSVSYHNDGLPAGAQAHYAASAKHACYSGH